MTARFAFAALYGSERELPLCQVLICRLAAGPGMNPNHHGSDEQMFGAGRQVLRGQR